MTFKSKPKLTLVGAGPGDPDLITVKGANVLKDADVILYDALLDQRLLNLSPNAIKVNVGKRRGEDCMTQDEINHLIVKYARRFGHVVRLKGGDPFVFGRGAEEIEYAQRKGVQTTVVPGLSSAIAVPSAAGIPLTNRGISRGFWVLTGTVGGDRFNQDLHLAIHTATTVVILMGMSKLDQILNIFIQNAQTDLPVAIIENGTTTSEKIVQGTVSTIAEKVSVSGLGTPAIIVIGAAVESVLTKQSRFQINDRITNYLNPKA